MKKWLRNKVEYLQWRCSEWLGVKCPSNLYSEDYASRLHLVETVLGLEEAEKFFENIPENMRDYFVYTTLLSSYTNSSNKNFHKSKETFNKMRELGFLLKPSPFNMMISLYNQSNMVDKILEEMEKNGVDPDSVIVNNVLKIYADESKVKAMEMFMKLWCSGEEDRIKLERGTMAAIANAYAKAGSLKKAITMYGDVAGSTREVYCLWNECKKKEKVQDDLYRTVISSLLKLNDVKGAENVYGEWKCKEMNETIYSIG